MALCGEKIARAKIMSFSAVCQDTLVAAHRAPANYGFVKNEIAASQV